MSDLDEGRDLHAAFGTLLADEPAAPWSVSDDVTRGRALQRRRRTRAGAGIGLAAAAVMVFGVFGPLRPPAAVVVPPAYQPPAVQGVDQAWLDSLSRSFTAVNATAVDWSTSTVTSRSDGGFALDLNLVGVTVTTGGEDFTVEYPPLPAPTVSRALVTWKPRGGAGPVLATCAAPECSRAEPSVSPGFSEEGGRWDADGAQIAGTFVVDHTFDAGGMLELATSPVVKDGEVVAKDWATLDYGGIRIVLDRVGRPTGEGTPLNDQFGVTSLLMDLGWTVDGVTVQRVPLGQPAEISWAVHRTGTDANDATGRLTIRTWDERSWNPGEGAIDPASVIAGCAKPGACSTVTSSIVDCVSATGCWSTSAATTLTSVGAAPARSYILYAYNEGAQHVVEAVVEPLSPGVPCMDTGFCQRNGSFLDEQETAQVVEVVKKQLDAPPSPAPSVTPTTPTPAPTVSSADPVASLLESYGFRVVNKAADEPILNAAQTYTVDLNRNVGTTATLSLTPYQGSGVPLGADRIDVAGTVLAGCTAATCAVTDAVVCTTTECASKYRLNVPCPTGSCSAYWAATTRASYTGVYVGTLAMFRSDGRDGAEAVVGLPTCPACGGSPGTQTAFLTVEQTQAVLQAFDFPRGGTVPGPSATPVSSGTCTPDQVKIVPAVDSTGGATGERSFALEVYARNPGVSCTVDGFPSATLLVGADPAPDLTYTPGDYGFPNVARGVSVGVDESNAAVFVVAKFRCDSGTVGRADKVAVTLPGSSTPVVVELPPGLAPELCTGTATDAGHEVWVSFFKPREGGVA